MSVRILQGDCRDVLRSLDEGSIDACVTDPPYHLTPGKKGGHGVASVNLNTPHGRARITTGFMGSGSTLKAAELEGFNAIGIELSAEYIEIAKRRIAADCPLFSAVEAA